MKKHIILALAFISSVAVQAETLKINRDQCRMMAIDASEDVAIARNTAEQARLDKKAAVTAYLPRLAGTASGIYRTPDSDVSGMTLSLKGVYMAGLTVTQPVYAGGKIVAANRLAEIGKKAAAEQQRMTRMDVIANADNAYWNYIAVLAKVDMTRAYLSQIDTVYAQTKTSYEVGMITQTDLVRIDARRSQIIYQLNQAESGADLCRLALCNILGVSSDTQIEPIDKDIPVTQPGNLSADIANRPELSLLKADVMAKEQQVKITRRLPSYTRCAGRMVSLWKYKDERLCRRPRRVLPSFLFQHQRQRMACDGIFVSTDFSLGRRHPQSKKSKT